MHTKNDNDDQVSGVFFLYNSFSLVVIYLILSRETTQNHKLYYYFEKIEEEEDEKRRTLSKCFKMTLSGEKSRTQLFVAVTRFFFPLALIVVE